MESKLVIKTGRSAVVEFDDGGKYYSKEEYTLLINGEEYGKTEKVVTTIYGLMFRCSLLILSAHRLLSTNVFQMPHQVCTVSLTMWNSGKLRNKERENQCQNYYR